jgi:hypothetical protein
MKSHRKFEELIQGYVDNALDDNELKALKKHLASCKECAKKLEERKELLKKLHFSKEEIKCPDNLVDNILKSTTRKETPEIISSFKIRWKYLAVSAAAVIIVISTVLLNIEEIDRIPSPQKPGKISEEILSKATEISETEEISSAAKETEDEKKEAALRTVSKEPGQVKFVLPEKKKGFAAVEKDKGSFLSGNIPDLEESGKAREQAPTITEKAEARPLIKMDMSEAKAPHLSETASERERPSLAVAEDVLTGEISSESNFEETRFVFPEEGSVVGNDFEIVLILEKPEEEIEISLDGERITKYTKEKDSNIIFIGSDSIPPLEEGLHFLSLKTKEEKNITFYKEG